MSLNRRSFLATSFCLPHFASAAQRWLDPEPALLLEGHEGPVRACDFSPSGDWIISAGSDGSIRLWDTRTGKFLRALQGHTGWVTLARVIAGAAWQELYAVTPGPYGCACGRRTSCRLRRTAR